MCGGRGQKGSSSGSEYEKSGGYNGGGNGVTSGGGGATHIATKTGPLSTLSSSDILIVAGGGGGGGSSVGGSGGGISGGWPRDFWAESTGSLSNVYYGTPGNQTAGGVNKIGTGTSSTGKGGFGYGGAQTVSSSTYGSNGGGGGWYGGGASIRQHAGGGGGSGYIASSRLVSGLGVEKGMYQYNDTARPTTNWDSNLSCTASNVVTTKTTCITSTGSHISNAANTGDGYVKITFLGTTL